MIDVIVGPDQFKEWMSSSALLVVVIAGLIGATPGCGGMIAVAVAYISIQDFPIAALISGGIATSGDGIFPLLANTKKDALLITGISLVIAIVVRVLGAFIWPVTKPWDSEGNVRSQPLSKFQSVEKSLEEIDFTKPTSSPKFTTSPFLTLTL